MNILFKNLMYGLFWVVIFAFLIPALVIIEQRYFSSNFRVSDKKTKPMRLYRQYWGKFWSILWGENLPLNLAVFVWIETAYLTALWLVLPYQMQIQGNQTLWLFLAVITLPLNIINSIITGEQVKSEVAKAGIFKNGISLLSGFIPLLLSILILITVNRYSGFAEISIQQGGFWLGFIPCWNIFRSPLFFLVAISFLVNLTTLMRLSDGDFKPLEFEESAEIYGGWHPSFGNLLQFNRSAMFFTLAALAVFLFFGGWQTSLDADEQHLASLFGGLIFIIKTILIFIVCLVVKYRLPILTNRQIININLKIQLPVLTLLWLGLVMNRWF
ncbi:MAG TPA: NADH-quinone oxidoreductase subunit H [Candidatus Marinimicrobia bacterium]|nr:NADH-quinone oxidoreductase subunit H [Candidatus Neomarinimicrobiota bacterium]HRS51582.1 NADH-quinone oxidoreductase subunit H [Candidatus Neomarinimicrobiota bacterium]HRU92340.1 NADH-quinone oxidoreductase subunit H [Candidatus Neomarinimicrobiota bacterium]